VNISYSQLSSFLKCGYGYYLRYVKGIKYPGNSDLYLGSAVHSTLEAYFKAKIQGIDTSREQLRAIFSDIFDSKQYKATEDGDEVVDLVWREDKGIVKDVGLTLVETYYDTILSKPRCPDPLESEFWFEKALDPEVTIRLKADLITASGKVIDFKIKRRAMPQADAERDLQPSIYALGLGTPGIAFEYHQLVRTKIPKVVIQEANRTEADIDGVANTLIPPIIKMIHDGIFPPSGMNTWACDPRWCDYCGTECRSPRQISLVVKEKDE